MKSYHIMCPNATTIIRFIVTAKILTVIRSISAGTVVINLHPNARGRRGQIVGGSIRLALCAERFPFCITIMSITLTTVAVTKSVTILSLNGNLLPFPLRLCLRFLANITLSVCAFLFKLLLRLPLLFLTAKEEVIAVHILPYFKNLKVNEIHPMTIRHWQSELMNNQKKYKPTYLRTLNSQLSAIFNFAVKYYGLSSNPVQKTGAIGKKNSGLEQFWTTDQFKLFIDAVSDKPQSKVIFNLLYWTGMRSGECLL